MAEVLDESPLMDEARYAEGAVVEVPPADVVELAGIATGCRACNSLFRWFSREVPTLLGRVRQPYSSKPMKTSVAISSAANIGVRWTMGL